MPDKTQQVIALVNNGKFKQALPKLKKLNGKISTTTYTTLALEGVCLLKEKKYALAEITLQKALRYANDNEEKCNTLLNLRTAAFYLNEFGRTIEYIKQLLVIDSSFKFAEQRLQLCQLLYDDKQYENILDYITPLYAVNEYFIKALPLAISSNLSLVKLDNITILMSKLRPEFSTISSIHAQAIVKALDAPQTQEQKEQLLADLKARFGDESWFIEAAGVQEQDDELSAEVKEQCKNIPSERVIADSPSVKLRIEKLIEQLEYMGAWFHPLLRFISDKGELSIRSYTSEQAPELQMRVPLTCMPLLADYEFSLSGNELSCMPIKKQCNPDANPVMESLISLYNDTNKLDNWRNSYPLFALAKHGELIDLLFKPLTANQKLAKYYQLFKNHDWPQLLLKSFFGAREFKYKKERLKGAGVYTSNESENGLLAIIDFLNHAHGQAAYEIPDSKGHMEINAIPESTSKEIFVQYSLLDPLRSYFIYGFVDESSPFRFSMPCQFSLSNGLEFAVNLLPAYAPKEVVGDEVQLRNYFPASIQRRGNRITLSHLAIPVNESKSKLSQVLISVLKKCNLVHLYSSEKDLLEDVKAIEKEIVFTNKKYWGSIREYYQEHILEDKDVNDSAKTELDRLIGLYENAMDDYIKYRQFSILFN